MQGSALWAWSLSPLLSHGPGLRGSFSLELPIGPKLAPTAKVLGYVVLPDSEMVADSTELKVEKCFANKVSRSCQSQDSCCHLGGEMWSLSLALHQSLSSSPATAWSQTLLSGRVFLPLPLLLLLQTISWF